MAEGLYGVRVATSKGGNAYIAGLYGKDGVARKLKEMGLERNEFQKLVKQAALIVAKRATRLAPVQSGRLATSIRGYAGKKVTRSNAPNRYLFGGVIVASARERGATDSYAKAVSFGRFYKRSDLGSRIGARVFRDSRGVRQENIRTKGNPYIRTARDQTRNNVVKMWNKEIGSWVRKNGFDTTGFGGA